MTRPSRLRCTSNSAPSAPSAIARAKARIVFSGASAAPPRWARINGDIGYLQPSWNGAAANVTSAPQLACSAGWPGLAGYGGSMKGVIPLACTAWFVILTAAHAASEADMRRAETLYQQGHFEEARAIYQSVPKSDKFYETALRQLGAFALYKNHLAEAELMLADAHARNPIDVSCDTLLAETYVREGKYFDMADLLHQLRRPDRAAEFELFGKSQPFRIAGKPAAA